MAAPIRHNDPANKRLFSHPRMVADLARLLGDDWVDDLDLDQLARLPAEHVADDLRKRLADMPWWAPFKPGGGRPAGAGVLFHIEFQSSPDPLMAERMLEYAALLRNDLARSGWKPAPGRFHAEHEAVCGVAAWVVDRVGARDAVAGLAFGWRSGSFRRLGDRFRPSGDGGRRGAPGALRMGRGEG